LNPVIHGLINNGCNDKEHYLFRENGMIFETTEVSYRSSEKEQK
jgi:hypothetical protein